MGETSIAAKLRRKTDVWADNTSSFLVRQARY